MILLVGMLAIKDSLTTFAGYLPILDNGYFGDLPNPSDADPSKDGVERLEDSVFSVLRNVRLIMGAVAVGILVYAGIMMVVRGDDEGEMTKQKSTIVYSIVGLAVIAVAGAVTELLSVENGGFLNPDEVKERAIGFRVEVNLIITFIKYLLGSLATLFIIIEGLKLVTAGSDESTVTNAKKKLGAAAFGLLLVIFSTTFIDRVFYVLDLNSQETGVVPQIDAMQGVAELVSITNIAVSIVGPIMILLLVAGGIMYIISAGDDSQTEKAKKLIFNAIIGIVVIYGAFAIVATFISGQI
ncbi:hypothetical protein HOG48_04525 [Candidatus Peregrinibacteria bacterium]|jgi:hypothetical protein|nr:hypothetical protein [Candidatus Peregrinibacteria bacterium]